MARYEEQPNQYIQATRDANVENAKNRRLAREAAAPTNRPRGLTPESDWRAQFARAPQINANVDAFGNPLVHVDRRPAPQAEGLLPFTKAITSPLPRNPGFASDAYPAYANAVNAQTKAAMAARGMPATPMATPQISAVTEPRDIGAGTRSGDTITSRYGSASLTSTSPDRNTTAQYFNPLNPSPISAAVAQDVMHGAPTLSHLQEPATQDAAPVTDTARLTNPSTPQDYSMSYGAAGAVATPYLTEGFSPTTNSAAAVHANPPKVDARAEPTSQGGLDPAESWRYLSEKFKALLNKGAFGYS